MQLVLGFMAGAGAALMGVALALNSAWLSGGLCP